MSHLVFFHNRYDSLSQALIARLPKECEIIDVYASNQPNFAGYNIRALPCLAVVSDYIPGQIFLVMEEGNIVPEVFQSFTLVEQPPSNVSTANSGTVPNLVIVGPSSLAVGEVGEYHLEAYDARGVRYILPSDFWIEVEGQVIRDNPFSLTFDTPGTYLIKAFAAGYTSGVLGVTVNG